MKRNIDGQKRLILETLKDECKTVNELALMMGLNDDTIRKRLKELNAERKIYVESWDDASVSMIARYRTGQRENAARPLHVKRKFNRVTDGELVSYVTKNPGQLSTEIAMDLNVSWNSLYQQLSRLCDFRYIERKGCQKLRFYPIDDSHFETYRRCFNNYMRSKTVGRCLKGRG